jgi:hypothetical protein
MFVVSIQWFFSREIRIRSGKFEWALFNGFSQAARTQKFDLGEGHSRYFDAFLTEFVAETVNTHSLKRVAWHFLL